MIKASTGSFSPWITCGYADLHDKMIHDCIIVSLRDARLSEKLQLDEALTSDKAVSTVRQAEAVKEQQAVLGNQYPMNKVKPSRGLLGSLSQPVETPAIGGQSAKATQGLGGYTPR